MLKHLKVFFLGFKEDLIYLFQNKFLFRILYLLSRCAFAHLHEHGTNLPISNIGPSQMTWHILCSNQSLISCSVSAAWQLNSFVECILFLFKFLSRTGGLKLKHKSLRFYWLVFNRTLSIDDF